jgi:hypothetical protein
MASAIIVTVFAGFAPTFYLRSLGQHTTSLTLLVFVHGAVFTAWIVSFLLQTTLIASGSREMHKRLGWTMVGMALLMVGLVCVVTLNQMRRSPPELGAFVLALNLFNIFVFACLTVAGVLTRNRADWHKRLMLAATISLIGAAIIRIYFPLLPHTAPPNVMLLAFLTNDLFFVPCFFYDRRVRGKVHAAHVCGLALILVSQIATPVAAMSARWQGYAQALR